MAEHELIWADTETGSTVDLKSAGTYRYAEDPSTHIQLFSYALNDGEVKIWDPHSGEEVPDDLCEYFDNPKYVFVFHNAQFDRLMIENCLGIRMPIQRYRCTMAQALSHALPAGLEKWEEVMGIKSDFQKIKDGKRLILKFCKPRKRKDGSMYWCTPETDPEDWARYKEYCRIDTAGMREASKKTPSFNYSFKGGTELEYWFMDQTINSRGLPIDLPLVNAAVEAIDDEQKLLSKKTRKMTNEEVQTAGQRDEMLKHIFGRYGIELPNMQKATLNKMVEDENLPIELRDLLQVRLSTCTTSTAKYKKLIKATCEDGNLKGTIQYAGASRTLRDAGRGAQVQNWPRPKLKHEEIIKGIQHVMDGTVIENGFDTMELTSSMLRYCIAAPKGFKFVVADLAGIENRVLAYLAGEEWMLEEFRKFDAGVGTDMYVSTYSSAFKVDIANVTKEQRQIGKTLALACGYQGGAGAIVTFALSFGINLHDLAVKVLPTIPNKIYVESESFYEWLDEMDWKAATKAALEAKKEWLKSNDPLIEDMPEFSAKEYYTAKSTYALGKDTFIAIDSLKRLWRESHPKTVDFWASTEQAVRDAVLCPNRNFYFGNGLYARRTRNWTKIVLPSGHVIPYPNMEIGKDGTLQFMGVDQFSKKWTLVKTFGGRLVENTVQAFSRSIFKHGQLLAEKRTKGIVMPLHDELVAKVPEDSDFTHKDLEQIMATNPPWAPDIPLAAEGWEDTRYHK